MDKKQKILFISLSIFFIIILIVTFIIININRHEELKIISMENNFKNLSMSVKENSLTNTEVTIIFTSDDEFEYATSSGDNFIVSKFKDNKWNELTPIKGNWNSTEMINYNPPTKKIEENINWREKYGELKKGKYKLEREILIDGNKGNYYIEFEIK